MVSTYSEMNGFDMPGLFIVADITAKSEDWNNIFYTIHAYTGFVLTVCLTLHLAAAVKHRDFDSTENEVLNRMI